MAGPTSLPAFTFTNAQIDQGFQGCFNRLTYSNLFDNCMTSSIAFSNTFSNCALTAQSIGNILVLSTRINRCNFESCGAQVLASLPGQQRQTLLITTLLQRLDNHL